MEPVIPLDRNAQGSSPTSRNSGYAAMPSSSLLPTASSRLLKTTPKTNVKISARASGLMSDQAQPSADRLYLPRSSRCVRLPSSSREAAYSARVVMRVRLLRRQRPLYGRGLGVMRQQSRVADGP